MPKAKPFHHPDAIARQERRTRVLALRRDGLGYREIAERVGVSHETVRHDLARVLDEMKPDQVDVDAMRAMENQRLDMQLQAANVLLQRAMGHVREVTRAAATDPKAGEFEQWVGGANVGGKLSQDMVTMAFHALDRMQRITESRRRLNGLDKAEPGGLPLPLPTASDDSSQPPALATMQAVLLSPELAGRVIELRRTARQVAQA